MRNPTSGGSAGGEPARAPTDRTAQTCFFAQALRFGNFGHSLQKCQHGRRAHNCPACCAFLGWPRRARHATNCVGRGVQSRSSSTWCRHRFQVCGRSWQGGWWQELTREWALPPLLVDRCACLAPAGPDCEAHWGYGATAARLTPDQKVGSLNLSALIFGVQPAAAPGQTQQARPCLHMLHDGIRAPQVGGAPGSLNCGSPACTTSCNCDRV